MKKTFLSNVDTETMVLAALSKLSPSGRLTLEATSDRIKQVLKDWYGKDLTERQIENILRNLQNRGFVYKKKGALRDGRVSLYGINPSKVTQEAFTVIEIDPERAYIHNGYEGLVYDPPSVGDETPKTTNTSSLLFCALAFGTTVTLLWLATNYKQVARQIQKDPVLLYPEKTKSNIGKKANTPTYACDYLANPILLYPNS